MNMPIFMVDAYETVANLHCVFTDRTTSMFEQLHNIIGIIEEHGDECAANCNAVCEKKPFNPVLATYAWDGWVE